VTGVPTVRVDGVPAGQGNLRRSPSGGMYESSHGTRPWRFAVAAAVRDELGDEPVTREPVALVCRFSFVRPMSHTKKSGGLVSGAPWTMVRNPDLDKLARAVLDALTGVLYGDDAQVVQLVLFKSYGPSAGLVLTWDILDPPVAGD
jgi:crossover junction endodeoxyribonuclease RusA